MTSPSLAAPLRTKRLRGPSIMFAVGIGLTAVCGVGAVANAADQPQIRYEVSGSSGVAEYISYQTDTGQRKEANVTLPWSTEFTAFGGQVFVLSAQGEGTISCRILVDGNAVNEATSAGRPGRAACSH